MGSQSLFSGPSGPMSGGAFVTMMAAYLTVVFVIDIIMYIAFVIPVWKLYKKAGQKYAWLAFIPIAQYWPFFGTIRKSAWNILWFLLPLVGVIFIIALHVAGIVITILLSLVVLVLEIVWAVQFFNAFRMSPWWLLLVLIPIVGPIGLLIVLYIMAFNDDYQYQL